MGHGSLPLGRQDSIFSIELHAKLRHPPPFASWAEALITQRVCLVRLFQACILFFFALHLILGEKSDYF